MRDTSVLLPLLLELNEKAKSDALSNVAIGRVCREYEDEMIPRTFSWVQKSGGTAAMVCSLRFKAFEAVAYKV
jgi:hypothetical protein